MVSQEPATQGHLCAVVGLCQPNPGIRKGRAVFHAGLRRDQKENRRGQKEANEELFLQRIKWGGTKGKKSGRETLIELARGFEIVRTSSTPNLIRGNTMGEVRFRRQSGEVQAPGAGQEKKKKKKRKKGKKKERSFGG